ncbi:hypothetical protein [Gimesia sp.]|uniref:hypothetical protein n=1 Tax=Gimesia sp. TaxID=2024833 RepID=UPI003A913420
MEQRPHPTENSRPCRCVSGKGFRAASTQPLISVAMYRLCSDVSRRLPSFHHVDMDRIAVAFAQARRNVPYGMQAKLTPLRFENGALQTTRYGGSGFAQRVYQDQQECCISLTFCLAVLNHSFKEDITVLHELYHISLVSTVTSAASQDITTYSHSQKEYDAHMAVLVDQYMKRTRLELFGFPRRFSTLQKKHGGREHRSDSELIR